VTGREAVPTLVDSDGYFFSSSQAFDPHPAPAEVEHALRAPIERAVPSGLKIDYVAYHMGTALRYPEMREIVERLAREYGLGMMGYFGDMIDKPQYWASPKDRTDSLVAFVNRLQPGVNVLVTHGGINDPEFAALVDMNTDNPLPDMSANRESGTRCGRHGSPRRPRRGASRRRACAPCAGLHFKGRFIIEPPQLRGQKVRDSGLEKRVVVPLLAESHWRVQLYAT
jgi:hypothetical protein